MSPDDPRHGTTAGHSAGCRERCCREARNADERRRRKYRDVFGICRLVDNTGTVRRIQALWALGWTSQHIAAAAGWNAPQAVTEIVKVRHGVHRTTAETIARVYDEMSMTLGPSTKNRREAARKGWAPPLAWDDIDRDLAPVGMEHDGHEDADERVVERILSGEWGLRANTDERLAVLDAWLARGGTQNELERRTGWNVSRMLRTRAA